MDKGFCTNAILTGRKTGLILSNENKRPTDQQGRKWLIHKAGDATRADVCQTEQTTNSNIVIGNTCGCGSGGGGDRLLKHKWKTFGRWTHLVLAIFPYLALLAAFAAAYQLRAAEIRAAASEPDNAIYSFQVHTHPH